jgi:PAS domain S-box-containing protein
MLRKLLWIFRILTLSESKYRKLIENAAAVIYSTDAQGYIDLASDKATELTGYSTGELAGMHYSRLVDPEGLKMVADHYQEQVRSGTRETSLVFPIRTKGGERKWVEQQVVMEIKGSAPAGFQCIVKDITLQKRIQEQLQQSESRLKESQLLLQSILENTSSVIFIKDLDGRYRLVNRQFREVLKVSDETVIGKTDYEFNPKVLADRYRALDEEVISTGKSVEMEEWIETPAGRRNFLLVKFPLLDADGKMFGTSGIATDITERSNFQQDLIRAIKDAEEAKKMQEQFLANMSHEIRTPMNGIQGMINLLLETPLSEEQKGFAQLISKSSNNLLVIINDILDFSKIKAGKLSIEKIDFSFGDVLENVKAGFAHRAKKKGLVIAVECDPAVPQQMRGDPYRLNQVLVNLVGNAIKFTEKGEIRIKISQKEATQTEAVIRFSVSDTGIGISEENLPHIFSSFSQAGIDTARRFGGTGLGLAICQQLIWLQNGEITVTSTQGEGSCFTFDIPYQRCETGDSLQQKAPQIYDHKEVLKGIRFLVAEDNEINQKLIEHVVKKAGGALDIVANGQEAIDRLSCDPAYDIIIMDLQMPVLDGYTAARTIRREMGLATPIIAMTATALKGERQRCLDAGVNEYMTKPFEFADLYRCVLSLLTKRSPVVEADPGQYDLSLLEEMNDEEYLREILGLFLTNTPRLLKELSEAAADQDFEKVYSLSHKLKGGAGMLRSTGLMDALSAIESQSRERVDTTHLIRSAITVFDELSANLKVEYINWNL